MGFRLAVLKKKKKKRKMYLIVEFEGEGTTGPVAKSWYADGYSWWPPYKDIDRLLKSVKIMETPQPEKGWTRHKTRILHESASFHNVANNWKKASYTSDINSEPEIAGKRIPKKKLCSNHIYSSDDEAPEQPPLKKRKTADKESVPPAPKPPSIPKRTKKKGPVVQPQVLQSRAVNSLSNSFVDQQQCDMEDQQQTWCESLPSFQAPVRVSQPDHHGDGWSVDPPNTQDENDDVAQMSARRACAIWIAEREEVTQLVEVIGVSTQHPSLTLLCSDFEEFVIPMETYHGSVDDLVENLPVHLKIKHIHKRVMEISFVEDD
ncbi:uncharacterized protein [Chanodichthys erythropterus]|uniref:uncharacterized protein n=1 Tax=Chanodichthys erythropterus TaxID=933992 RepID=UPI00351DB80C